ncbi:hypothetical protein EGY05_09075 [Chryseobacterium arthrosphaerae]|nr:hypothetical protein EGY05_09075 [Chryseobacterium arthrosphaerae]
MLFICGKFQHFLPVFNAFTNEISRIRPYILLIKHNYCIVYTSEINIEQSLNIPGFALKNNVFKKNCCYGNTK